MRLEIIVLVDFVKTIATSNLKKRIKKNKIYIYIYGQFVSLLCWQKENKNTIHESVKIEQRGIACGMVTREVEETCHK